MSPDTQAVIEKNKNLIQRIVSSLVLLPIIVFLVYRGGWWTGALTGLVAAITAGEYYVITLKRLSPAGWVGVVWTGAMPIFPVWALGQSHATEHAGDICFWWVAAFFFFCWGYHLLRGPLHDAPLICSHLVSGLLYGALGMTALSELRMQAYGLQWLIATLVITWGNDTCAYFAGRSLGRHKLYPEVSPNKTWEGFFGGMAGSVGGMFVYRALWDTPFTPLDCVVVGIAGGILGPIGDLAESMLKRAYGVKDSGKIIPGHGGLLDRIDALSFNAPMVFLYVHFARLIFSRLAHGVI